MENNEAFMSNSPTISDCGFYWHGDPNFHPTLRLLKRQKMIKANDLRIGNYILSVDNQEGVVISLAKEGVGIKISELLFSYEFYEKVNPIPLTKEWLLKFGFERTKVPMKSDIEYIDYRMGQFVLFILPKGIVEVEFCAAHNKIDDRGYLCALKNVHQLQNLYFALTGEELKID